MGTRLCEFSNIFDCVVVASHVFIRIFISHFVVIRSEVKALQF